MLVGCIIEESARTTTDETRALRAGLSQLGPGPDRHDASCRPLVPPSRSNRPPRTVSAGNGHRRTSGLIESRTAACSPSASMRTCAAVLVPATNLRPAQVLPPQGHVGLCGGSIRDAIATGHLRNRLSLSRRGCRSCVSSSRDHPQRLHTRSPASGSCCRARVSAGL